jgi:hypothetical protein
MKHPAASYEASIDHYDDDDATRICPPECFNRGSTLLTTTVSRLSKGRGPVPSFAWIPAKTCAYNRL